MGDAEHGNGWCKRGVCSVRHLAPALCVGQHSAPTKSLFYELAHFMTENAEVHKVWQKRGVRRQAPDRACTCPRSPEQRGLT